MSVCRMLLLQRKLNWATQKLPLGRMRPAGRGLDIAALAFMTNRRPVYKMQAPENVRKLIST